jgi:hypothetical protein
MPEKDLWQMAAYNYVLAWRRQVKQDRPMTFEAVRLAVAAHFLDFNPPVDGRWWGAVAKWLIREGALRRCPGFGAAASSHGAAKPVYWVTR